MATVTPETRVGIFVVAGIALLVLMSMWLGGFRFASPNGYDITVRFPNAAGLDRDAFVAIAGVEVGRVKDISLDANMAKLTLEIDSGVEVGSDFTAVMKTSGLLGEKYVELVPGAPGAPALADGGELKRVGVFTDMDRLISVLEDVANDVKEVTGSLNAVLSDEGGDNLKKILSNIAQLTASMNILVKSNDDKFSNVMTNMDKFFSGLSAESPGILKGLKDVTVSLNKVIAENRGGIKESVEHMRSASLKLEAVMDKFARIAETTAPKVNKAMLSIESVARKIDEGTGTIGKLVNEPDIANKLDSTLSGVSNYIERAEALRLFVGYRGEYLFDAKDTKSFLTIKAQPRDDKFYLFEVVDDPRGRRNSERIVTTEGGVTTTRDVVTTQDNFLFSAQLAKQMRDVTLRGGIIESRGGVGLDYHFYDDRFKLSFDIFDFDRARHPHMKIGATVFLGKHFLFSAGYDDFVSRIGMESAYIGFGLRFEDKDLKYLIGSAPSISFK